MIIRLDMASEIPIYVQLRNAIVVGIGKGELVPGEGLPAVRQMAEDMDIPLTDQQVYDISQKLISSRGARSPRFARQYLIDLKRQLLSE